MEITWIFFDCFNTLIDDFDPDGDETGIKPLGKLAVDAGWCDHPDDFHASYKMWRTNYWDGSHWREAHLRERLQMVLDSRPEKLDSATSASLIEAMLERFLDTFPETVRPAPGVRSMLDRLQGSVQMGVVSNFFLPDMPEDLLKAHSLRDYFNFVLDSAQLGVKKPEPEIYRAALQRAGIRNNDTSQVLFIGDSLDNDYHAPRQSGLQSMFFDRSRDRPSPPAPPEVQHIRKWGEFFPDIS